MFQAVLKNNPKQIKKIIGRSMVLICMYMYRARAMFKNSKKSNSKNI